MSSGPRLGLHRKARMATRPGVTREKPEFPSPARGQRDPTNIKGLTFPNQPTLNPSRSTPLEAKGFFYGDLAVSGQRLG